MDNDGMTIDLLRANGKSEQLGEFAVVGIPYMDLVFELRRGVFLCEGDQLKFAFHVPVVSKVSGRGIVDMETHRYTEDWKYRSPIIEHDKLVTHFRFTKIKDDAWIELLGGMPEGCHVADVTKAEKIR